jgi:serine protease inhibitor
MWMLDSLFCIFITYSSGKKVPSQGPIAIRLDHPFLFLILDRPTGAILFMGRVEDPR